MVVFNGRVTTMDRARPEATAFALRDGVFTAVGTDAEILPLAGPGTRRVDAAGRRVIPGLNDSHTHTVRGGLNYALELRWDGIPTFAKPWPAARHRRPHAAGPVGARGRRLLSLAVRRRAAAPHPRRAERDRARHAGLRAEPLCRRLPQPRRAARAEHHRDTPDNAWPEGTIERGPDRQPTGLLLGSPSALILYDTLYKGPRLDDPTALVSTRHFMRELNRLGITSSLDCGAATRPGPTITA
jgi:predicted amidohydrolase YtcJ